MTSVAVIGDPVLDQIYHSSDPILPGGKMLGRFFGSVPGGTTANFACAAARFGLEVQMIGRVADTWEGKLHADALTAFDVNTDGLSAHDVPRGAHTVIVIGPDGYTFYHRSLYERWAQLYIFENSLAYFSAEENLSSVWTKATASCLDRLTAREELSSSRTFSAVPMPSVCNVPHNLQRSQPTHCMI